MRLAACSLQQGGRADAFALSVPVSLIAARVANMNLILEGLVLMRKQMALNDHVRDSTLDKRVRQVAIMTTVRFWNSEYPWGVQARLSHELGVDAAIIDAINTGERPKLDDSREAAAYEVASELLAEKRLSDKLYAKAEKLFTAFGVKLFFTDYVSAELVKLFNNISRYLEFALANQFAAEAYGEASPPFLGILFSTSPSAPNE